MESRLKEAAKLGFGAAIMPRRRQRRDEVARDRGEAEISVREVSKLGELVAIFEGSPKRAPGRAAAR